MTPTTKNLLTRIQDVAKVVGSIHPGGKNAQGRPALSIEDVENAVRDALAQAGVVTLWSDESVSSWREPTKSGEMTLWRVRCKVALYNCDDPTDLLEAYAEDTGGTPAGAKSFARKGFYKALFHLASGEDDAIPVRQPPRRDSGRTAPTGPAPANGDLATDIRSMTVALTQRTGETAGQIMADMQEQFPSAVGRVESWDGQTQQSVADWLDMRLSAGNEERE